MKSKDFIRSETNPGALISIDNSGLSAYKRQREVMRSVTSQEERIQKIESNIDEVKSMLKQLLENGNNK